MMPLEELLSKMRGMFPDMNRKRRRNSNCVDSGPPPKLTKNLQEHRFLRDDQLRIQPLRKSFLGSMGSIFSKFKSQAPVCEPTECEEYSDGEDLIILQKFKKSDLAAPRLQPISNYQFEKMDAVNNKSNANRPPPALIPKNKWTRVPDLQKMNPARAPRVNGYQYDSDTISTRNHLMNGNSLSFKPQKNQQIENGLGRNFSNYISTPASTGGPKYPSFSLMQPSRNAAEDKARFEKLLRSVAPEYAQTTTAADTLPTSRRKSLVQNHVSSRPSLRTSGAHLLDDDFYKKQEDARRLFAETSIKSERKVAPVNTMQMKLDSSIVCKKAYPEIVKEKYSTAILQRHEKITQQEETINQLNTLRLKRCSTYEHLAPTWRTPDVVIFDEDIEEKVDDFPEFTDSQRQTIRQAMSGSPHQILISKFNIQITRSHLHTLQWEPLAWLNDEVINFYMSLLTERGELRAGDGYPKVYAMNTFFTQRLFTGGHSAVKRWTKKVDLFACDIIPVPVHVGNVHWCMAIINMKEKTIKYYDSMGAPNNRVLIELEAYLRQESLDKRKIEFDMSGWSKENVTDNPRQENGSDCGVFSCMTAEFVCRNRPILFNQQNMNYFRQKMVLEICTGKLLL